MGDSATLASARRAMVATFDDDADVPNAGQWRALHYNGAEAATVALILADDPDGSDPVPHGLQPGGILDVSVKRIFDTGTDAAAGSVILWR